MPPSRESKKSLSQRLCKWLYILMKYLLAIALTAVMCIPAIYHLSFQHAHQTVEHPLHKSFRSPIHLPLLQKLHSSPSVFLYGKDPKQIEHFVNFYAHDLALKGWKTVKWELDTDVDIVDYVSVNDLKMGLQDFIDVENDEISTLWIIVLNSMKQKLWQVTDLVRRYPDDRFVIINQKKEKIPGSVGSFQYFKIPQIPQSDFEQALMEHLNITAFQSNVLISHYGSIPSTLQQVDSECADLQCLLGSSYHQLTSQQSKKDVSNLKKLCVSGKLKQRQQSVGMNRMGAFFYDGQYFWRDVESALNFELQVEEKIKGAQKGCKYIDSELMIWQIPSQVIDEGDQNQQEREEGNDNKKSYEWNLEEDEKDNQQQDKGGNKQLNKDDNEENTRDDQEDNQEDDQKDNQEDDQEQNQDDNQNDNQQGNKVYDDQRHQQVNQEDQQQYEQVKSEYKGIDIQEDDSGDQQEGQQFDQQEDQQHNQENDQQKDQDINQNQQQNIHNLDDSQQNHQLSQDNQTGHEQKTRQHNNQSMEQAQANHQNSVYENQHNHQRVRQHHDNSDFDKRDSKQQNNYRSNDKQTAPENYENEGNQSEAHDEKETNQEHHEDQETNQKVQQKRSSEHRKEQPVLVDSAL